MICALCGMQHRTGENKRCVGPFVTLERYEKDVRALKIELGYVLNAYKALLAKQPYFPSQSEEDILDRAERVLA